MTNVSSLVRALFQNGTGPSLVVWLGILNGLQLGALLLFIAKHIAERRKRQADIDLQEAQAELQRALFEKTDDERWMTRLDASVKWSERLEKNIASLEEELKVKIVEVELLEQQLAREASVRKSKGFSLDTGE